MATTWYEGKVIKITDETASVKRFEVEIQNVGTKTVLETQSAV